MKCYVPLRQEMKTPIFSSPHKSNPLILRCCPMSQAFGLWSLAINCALACEFPFEAMGDGGLQDYNLALYGKPRKQGVNMLALPSLLLA